MEHVLDTVLVVGLVAAWVMRVESYKVDWRDKQRDDCWEHKLVEKLDVDLAAEMEDDVA